MNPKLKTLSLSRGYAKWLESDSERVFVPAADTNESRTAFFFGSERAGEDEIAAFYLHGIKRCVFEPLVASIGLPYVEKEMLTRTLVAFDRERDELLVRSKLRESTADVFSLDGFYNFRLRELKKRWMNLADTVRMNAPLIRDPESFNVVLRFLLSTVTPKKEKVSVVSRGDGYVFSDSCDRVLGGDELIFELIDVAPMSVNVSGKIADERVNERLHGIFDVICDGSRTYFY